MEAQTLVALILVLVGWLLLVVLERRAKRRRQALQRAKLIALLTKGPVLLTALKRPVDARRNALVLLVARRRGADRHHSPTHRAG